MNAPENIRPYTVIDLEQGSQAWLDWRKTVGTASEAATVLGKSPWEKPLDLIHKKRDGKTTFVNSAMARGTNYEADARAWWEAHCGEMGEPIVLQRDNYGASLDWLSYDRKMLAEFKVPKDEKSDLWTSSEVPEHYNIQIQQQMFVADVDEAYLVVYMPESRKAKVYSVKRDHELWATIETAWIAFWAFYEIAPKWEPEEVDIRTDPEWEALSTEFLACQRILTQVTEQSDELKKKLIALAKSDKSKGFGVSVIKSVRQGNVDYKKIPELKGVDLDQYRGKSIDVWTVSTK